MALFRNLVRHRNLLLTLLADAFFVCILVYFGLGGWVNAYHMLRFGGPAAWAVLSVVLFLILFRSDYRIDIPLFFAGLSLGYWGEWWGTTRGVWTYWNNAQPPIYLPPLWGIGLITVYRLSRYLVRPRQENPALEKPATHPWVSGVGAASFFVLPALAFANSLPRLAAVDWHGRLDAHFVAGIVVTLALLLPRFELRETFAIYLCGMLLGGIYEYLGTSIGEWTYITAEVPPLWIAPLWGLAAAAMVRLARLIRWAAAILGQIW
ncbi:hypothetical protein EHM76_00475 [bacterium]|nr:MAG: hypothetical protein EHM76_00475 [bacterium]